jgi:hypothetical protein
MGKRTVEASLRPFRNRERISFTLSESGAEKLHFDDLSPYRNIFFSTEVKGRRKGHH